MPRHTIFVLAVVLFAAACSVPLGPGFFIERESLDARILAAPQPALEISARFEISNAGNVPLDAVALALPGSGYAHANLRVEVAGRSVEPQGTPRADTPVVRVPIEPPLALQAKTVVTVSFALTQAGEEIGGCIAADAVFLPPGAWTPRLLPPEKLFAKGGQRPKKFDFNVTVPAEFRVHAGGKSQGPRGATRDRGARSANPASTEITHRFLLRDDDPEPYLLAGKFSAASYSAHRATVTFWTPEPMPPAAIEQSGKRLTTAFTRLAELLGPLQMHASRFVFLAASASHGSAQKSEPVFPDAGVVETTAIVPASVSPDANCDAVFTMSHAWIGQISAPQKEIANLSFALERRLASLADPSCFRFLHSGSADRETAIRQNLASYSALNRMLELGGSASAETIQWQIESARHTLFLFALDDELGADVVHRALRHLLQSLRGSAWGENDLRAALEAESRRNLGPFFRAWLHSGSLPDSFRAKYTKP